jgi:hypothetical protein
VATEVARDLVHDVELVDDAYAAARHCDALIVVTEWNEFKNVDLLRLREELRRPVIIDGRNIYDPTQMDAMGFIYRGMGRGYGGTGMGKQGDEGELVAQSVTSPMEGRTRVIEPGSSAADELSEDTADETASGVPETQA